MARPTHPLVGEGHRPAHAHAGGTLSPPLSPRGRRHHHLPSWTACARQKLQEEVSEYEQTDIESGTEACFAVLSSSKLVKHRDSDVKCARHLAPPRAPPGEKENKRAAIVVDKTISSCEKCREREGRMSLFLVVLLRMAFLFKTASLCVFVGLCF